jgi:hypothetical protein
MFVSKEINDILKGVNKNHQDIYKPEDNTLKNIVSLNKDVEEIKKQINTMIAKLDTVVEMMMTLTLFIEESVEMGELDNNDEDYESNEGWIPDNEEWRESLEDEDLEDD